MNTKYTELEDLLIQTLANMQKIKHPYRLTSLKVREIVDEFYKAGVTSKVKFNVAYNPKTRLSFLKSFELIK